MANKLVVIGWLGVKRAYLNVDRAEALRRYNVAEGNELGGCLEAHDEDGFVEEFEFNDTFGVYAAWAQPEEKR